MVSLTLSLPDVPGLNISEKDFQSATNYPNKPRSFNFIRASYEVDKSGLRLWIRRKRVHAEYRRRKRRY